MHVAIAFFVGLVVGSVLGYVFRVKIAAEEAYLKSKL